MLEDRGHWEDVGYEVTAGNMVPGTNVEILRPDRNSPTQLKTPDKVPLVEVKEFNGVHEEVNYCADQFQKFIEGGLQPEDLMAIAIDDRAAKSYLSLLAEALAERKISSNNIIADRYSEPAFQIEGRCTLTTVYRAKGNEAAVVVVLGCDAIPLKTRSGRNRLFTAFTRTKGWLRITGMAPSFTPLRQEIQKALDVSPHMKFKMPDPKNIEMIQRDLAEKDAKIQRARAELDRFKDAFGLSDEELREALSRH